MEEQHAIISILKSSSVNAAALKKSYEGVGWISKTLNLMPYTQDWQDCFANAAKCFALAEKILKAKWN